MSPLSLPETPPGFGRWFECLYWGLLGFAAFGGSEIGSQTCDDFAGGRFDAVATSVAKSARTDGCVDAGVGDCAFGLSIAIRTGIASATECQGDLEGDASIAASAIWLASVFQTHYDTLVVLSQDLGLVVGDEPDEFLLEDGQRHGGV